MFCALHSSLVRRKGPVLTDRCFAWVIPAWRATLILMALKQNEALERSQLRRTVIAAYLEEAMGRHCVAGLLPMPAPAFASDCEGSWDGSSPPSPLGPAADHPGHWPPVNYKFL